LAAQHLAPSRPPDARQRPGRVASARAQLDPRQLKDHKRVPGIEEMFSAFDFEPVCFANMTLRNYDYMAHGGDSEFTLRRNREAFEWVELVERAGGSPDGRRRFDRSARYQAEVSDLHRTEHTAARLSPRR
jgi:hypothetical protein